MCTGISKGRCVKGVDHPADLSISRRNQWVSGDTERIVRTGWPWIESFAYLNLIRRGTYT